MEAQEEELSDEELARRLRFWARRAYGGERELLEKAERRILKKSESNESGKDDSDGNAGCGCLVLIVVLAILLKIIGCV